MKVVADTGPLLAAANHHDSSHRLARSLVEALGRRLVILDPVIVEADHLLRSRIGDFAARAFLASLVAGEHSTAFMTPGLLRRAAEIDTRYAALGLGLVDASIMAYAERHDLPVLTFDFRDFRAAQPAGGRWRLLIDEARYREATGG